MTENQAKVHLSLRDGTLELEGSERFVGEQLERLRPLIEGSFKRASPRDAQGSETLSADATETENLNPQQDPLGIADYENLFAEADGRIQILKTLPGANKASKTVSGALLLTFANGLLGSDSTTASDVRDLCKTHACLDSSNFSSTIKAQKEFFLISGSGGSQSYRLTVPGRKKAEDLARQLN